MEEQSKQTGSEDVEAHIRPGRDLRPDEEPADEHGRRNLVEDDDDVEAHIRPGRDFRPGRDLRPDDEESTDEHGRRN